MIQKSITAFALVLLIISGAGAQNMGSLTFIENLGNREQATLGDAVTFYMLTLNKPARGFKADLSALKRLGILDAGALLDSGKKDVLRKGVIAGMIARHLKLRDSIWYLVTGFDRYAYRACVAAKILPPKGSEWDKVSGEELIEMMRRVGERSGGVQ